MRKRKKSDAEFVQNDDSQIRIVLKGLFYLKSESKDGGCKAVKNGFVKTAIKRKNIGKSVKMSAKLKSVVFYILSDTQGSVCDM